MLNLQAAEHVRYESEDHGGVVILDSSKGLWITLNPTAGDFWRSWHSGGEFERGVAEVAARYPDVPVESIRADAEHLVRDLFSRGLIDAIPDRVTSGAKADMAEPAFADAAGRREWLRVAAAWVALCVASVLLRWPFRLSFGMVRASRRHWCCQVATPGQAEAAVAAVSRAARRYPGRAACLEQSLAAVLLGIARRRRIDWCLGSAQDPIRFHAWVEVGGETIPRSRLDYNRVLLA